MLEKWRLCCELDGVFSLPCVFVFVFFSFLFFFEESSVSLTFVLAWSSMAAWMYLYACNICKHIACVYMKTGSLHVHTASLAAVHQRDLHALNLQKLALNV